MPASLGAYAPLRIVDHDLVDGSVGFTAEATALFVDLVGFTPLTDRLGQFGSRGTEQLSQVLQTFFGAVTDEALSRGGDPVAYGGDALTILFDGQGPETVAAACALSTAIQLLTTETTGLETLAGPVSLHTRIGIGRGRVSTRVVRANDRLLPIQLGEGLDRAATAESAAAVGQVVYDTSVADFVACGEDSMLDQAARVTPRRRPDAVHDGSLAGLVHPSVLQHLLADSSLWQSHRTATIAFIGFPAVRFDQVDDFALTAAEVVRRVDDCGGEVVQISGGDKGVVGLAVFGAPVGHDDDALRALQAVLEVRRLVPSIRVGMTTGPLFATWLGSEHRRFPAHLGGALNIAARLMQAAEPREVLLDPTTWEATGPYVRQRGKARQLHVKGHADAIEARGVAGWRRRRRRSTSSSHTVLTGRGLETQLLEDLLDRIQAENGHALTLVGDPGIGKTRLALEAVDRARVRGVRVVMVDVEDHPHGRSSGVWRDLLAPQLGLSPSSTRREWHAGIEQVLTSPATQLGLLDQLLGLGHVGDPGPEVEPTLAVELAQEVVARLVLGAAAREPMLIVLENAHQLPTVSRSVLTHLEHRVDGSPVGLLVTERPSPTVRGDGRAVAGSTRRLPELSETASRRLVEDTWRQLGGGSPPPWLAAQIYEQTRGNPLYLVTATGRVRSRWRPGDPPPAPDPEADRSLTGALTERIDQLDVGQRQVLRVLACAQRPCRASTLVEVLRATDDDGSVEASDRLVDSGLVRLLRTPDGERYRIAHDLIRHVAYEQLSHDDRARTHRALAERLIGQGAAPGEIAYHLRHLDDPELGRQWYPLAGMEARRSWAVAAAIQWWRLSMPLLEGQAREEAEVELSELLLVGGRASEVLQAAGISTGGATSSGQAPFPDGGLLVRRSLAVAQAAYACGEFDRCQDECALVMQIAEGTDEDAYQRAAELAVRAMCDLGQLTEAVAMARAQLTRTMGATDLTHVATASASLGAALLLSGEPSEAIRYYEAALDGAHSTGDLVYEVHSLSDLAGCAYALDDYDRCLDLLVRARELAESIGYRRHLQYSLNNEAELRAGLGDPHADACALAAAQRALELSDAAGVADALEIVLRNDSESLADLDGWQRLAAAEERLGRVHWVAECYANLAVAAARTGDRDTVEMASRRVKGVSAGTGLDQGSHERRVELAAALLAARRPGITERDRLDLARRLEVFGAEPDVAEVERAELLVAAWKIAPDRGRARRATEAVRAAFEAEPTALVRSWFDDLGIEQPAALHVLPPPVGITDTAVDWVHVDEVLSALEALLDSRAAA